MGGARCVWAQGGGDVGGSVVDFTPPWDLFLQKKPHNKEKCAFSHLALDKWLHLNILKAIKNDCEGRMEPGGVNQAQMHTQACPNMMIQ